MKKLVFFLSFFCFLSAQATIYETNSLSSTSVTAYEFEDEDIIVDDISIPNGELVEMTDSIIVRTDVKDNVLISFAGTSEFFDFARVKYKDKEYLINPTELTFSEANNPENAIDYLRDFKLSFIERLYNGYIPFTLIFILLLASVICTWLANKMRFFVGDILLLVVPILTALVIIIEVVGIFAVGENMFWFLNNSRYGIWVSLFRLFPFLFCAYLQFRGMKFFLLTIENRYYWKDRSSKDVDMDSSCEISIKPLIWTFIIGFICTVIAIIVTASVCNSDFVILLVLLLCLAAMGWVFYRVSLSYQEQLGKFIGILFTIYAIIWSFGAIIAAIIYIWGIFKVIIPLIIAGAIIGILFAVGSAPMAAVGGVGGLLFRDKHGGEHVTRADAERYNETF